MTFLEPAYNPLSSPKTLMTFIWEQQRHWNILHRSSATKQQSEIIFHMRWKYFEEISVWTVSQKMDSVA
jgi:glutathionylspermidine synthase